MLTNQVNARNAVRLNVVPDSPRTFRRTIRVEGVMVSINLSGETGTLTMQRKPSDAALTRICEFFHVSLTPESQAVLGNISSRHPTRLPPSVQLIEDRKREKSEASEEGQPTAPVEPTPVVEDAPAAPVPPAPEAPSEEIPSGLEEPVANEEDADSNEDEATTDEGDDEGADEPSSGDAEPTAEEVLALKQEVGTWANVADRLGLTTSQLNKLRKSLGI